ncbi:MAG: DUF6499 domain-containing protein [Hyphomonadaceae bacterium]
MTPDASGWRSSKGYDHVEQLTASDLAWEWLRRNESYDHDFRGFAQTKGDPRPLTDKIRQRWGLRFPGRPADRAPRFSRVLVPTARHERSGSRNRASDFFSKNAWRSRNR